MVETPCDDSFVEQLDDEMKEGGGCAEAWATATRLRKSNSKTAGSSRREFVGSVVASIVFGIGATGSAAAKEHTERPEEVDLQTTSKLLPSRETTNLVTQARSTKGVKLLERKLRPGQPRQHAKENLEESEFGSNRANPALQPDLTEATAYHVEYEQKSWEFVHIPYRHPRPQSKNIISTDAGILWSTRDQRDPIAYNVTYRDETDVSKPEIASELSDQLRKDIDPENVRSVKEDMILLQADNGEILTSSWTDERALTTNEEPHAGQPTTQADDLMDCVCYGYFAALCSPCGLPDWGCTVQLAEHFSVEIAACGTCAVTKNSGACAACLGAIVETGLGGEFDNLCCPCNSFI